MVVWPRMVPIFVHGSLIFLILIFKLVLLKLGFKLIVYLEKLKSHMRKIYTIFLEKM